MLIGKVGSTKTAQMIGKSASRISNGNKTKKSNTRIVGNRQKVIRYFAREPPENNDLMPSSYVMIYPLRHLLGNVGRRYTEGVTILDVGIVTTLEEVVIDTERFQLRGGVY